MHALEVIKYIDLIIYNDEKIRSIIHDDIFHLIAMQG
jgi:hypothetical protein